jgi:arylsulfatase A-like enzyme
VHAPKQAPREDIERFRARFAHLSENRATLIVSWPRGIRGGRTVNAPVISLDILPTALDALDVPLPDGTLLDGKCLLPLLDGRAETVHENLFWSSGGADGEWAVRSGDWKLVGIRERRLLFDLAADASERVDLATRRPEIVAELTRLYDRWLDRMAEPLHGEGKRWVQGAISTREKQR